MGTMPIPPRRGGSFTRWASSMAGRCTPLRDARSRKRTPRSRSSRRPQRDKLTLQDRFKSAVPAVSMIPQFREEPEYSAICARFLAAY